GGTGRLFSVRASPCAPNSGSSRARRSYADSSGRARNSGRARPTIAAFGSQGDGTDRIRTPLAERGDGVGSGRLRSDGAVDGGGRDICRDGLCRSAAHTRDRGGDGAGRASIGYPQTGIATRAVVGLVRRRIGPGGSLRHDAGIGGALV